MGKSSNNFGGGGGGDYHVGCRHGHPFVIPNVNQISITNSPSGSLLNHFQPIQNTSPSVRGIRLELCLEDISMGIVSGFVDSSHKGVLF